MFVVAFAHEAFTSQFRLVDLVYRAVTKAILWSIYVLKI